MGEKGTYPIIDQSQMETEGWTDDTTAVVSPRKPIVVFGDHTCAVKYVSRPFFQGADSIKILETADNLLPKFLFYYLKAFPVQGEGYRRHFSKLAGTGIPLPSLRKQERIVAKLDGYHQQIAEKEQEIREQEEVMKHTIDKSVGIQ